MEEKSQSRPTQKWIIILLLVLILLLGIILAVVLLRKEPQNILDGDTPLIGYAAEATVMLDQDSLQAAFDAAMENAKNSRVALQYSNDAYSENGTDFECRIINSASNMYDMYLTIFADATLTDQIFLSGLVPPGSGFENITLDRALDQGDHRVYVALTQVDTNEEGEQVLVNQVMHTMDFHVE